MASAVATGLTNIGTGTTPVSLTFGFDPTVTGCGIVFWWSGRTTNGVARGNVQAGYGIAGYRAGAAAGTISVAGSSKDTGTSDSASGMRDDAVIHALTTSGADAGIADWSWTSTGGTITPRTSHTFTNDLVIHWWAVPIAALATFTAAEPTTATTSQTTGLPASPMCGIVPAMGNVGTFSSPSATANDFNLSFGFFLRNPAGSIENGVMAGWSDDALATTASRTYVNMTECMGRGTTTATTTPLARASCTAIGSSDFTWTYGAVEGPGTATYPVLLFFGGLWKSNQITDATNTSTDMTITPGFPMLGMLTMMMSQTAFNTAGTAGSSARLSLGMANSTGTEHAAATRDTNLQAGGVCTIGSDSSHCIYTVTNTGPAADSVGHITAVGATTVTMRMTTAPGTAFLGIALSVGIVDITGSEATTSAGTVGAAVTVGITGNSATAAAGDLTPSGGGGGIGDVTVAITGSAATGSGGTTAPSSAVPSTGNAASASGGTLGPGNAVASTGAASTTAAGTMGPAAAVPLAGIAATSAAGSLAASAATGATGSAATTGAGNAAPGTAVAISGSAATIAAGTLTASGGSGNTAALTGAAATASPGALAPSSSIPVTGSAASTSPGTLAPAAAVGATGGAATSAAGSAVPSSAVPLVGSAATVAAGTMVASGGNGIAITGNAATASPGDLAPSRTVPVGGNSSTTSTGTLVPAPGVPLVGVAFGATAGTVTNSTARALAGAAATMLAGVVAVPGSSDVSAALTGSGMTAYAGTLVPWGRGQATIAQLRGRAGAVFPPINRAR